MGLFDLFKKQPKLSDSVFGELTVDSHFLTNENFFFAPANSTIQIIIDAEKEASEAQRDFYQTIEMKYPETKQKVYPIMLDLFRNWKDDFEIKDFDMEFPIGAIKIPDLRTQPIIWEIAYKSVHDDHEFTVTFRDFEPDPEIVIDG